MADFILSAINSIFMEYIIYYFFTAKIADLKLMLLYLDI